MKVYLILYKCRIYVNKMKYAIYYIVYNIIFTPLWNLNFDIIHRTLINDHIAFTHLSSKQL